MFLFLFASFAWFYHAGEHNENAHLDQIRALAEEGSWQIDRFAGNTADVITVGGHIYPNKAPGITYLGVLPWIFFRGLLSIAPLSQAAQLHFTAYLVTLTTLGFFSSLTGCALFALLGRLGLAVGHALLFALLYSLGTIAFPFSTVLFSHQLAASFLFLGFFLLCDQARHEVVTTEGRWRRRLQIAGAGLLLGFAPVLEYPAALGTIIVGIYGLTTLRWRAFLIFIAAGVAAGSLLLIYNWYAFHHLFFLSYEAYQAPGAAFGGHAHGFVGVAWPSPGIFWEITFGPQRGLFYVNPWLFLIVPALLTLTAAAGRRELIVCFAMVVAFFAFNSGFGDSIVYWGGAWSIGPRHLIPMLPFMAVPIALLCRRRIFFLIAAGLGGFSLLTMFCVTAITPCLSYEAHGPYLFYLRQFFLGRFSLNADAIFAGQIVPGYSFNLGQLLGLPPRAQLLPFALLWAVALPMLLREACPLTRISRPRLAGWATLGFSCALVVVSLAPLFWDPYAIERPGWSHGLAGAMAPGLLVNDVSSADADATFLPSTKTIRRHDDVLDFAWDTAHEPFPAPYGGIWKGALYVPETGIYRLTLESDDGSALYVDSYAAIDHWRIGSPSRASVVVKMSRGFHPIAVQYENILFTGRLAFFWAPPDLPMEIIPPEYLFSR